MAAGQEREPLLGTTTARRLRRHGRRARWFHAGAYLLTLPLLFTGWWLLLGAEGSPSPLARALNVADADAHTWLGWALGSLGLIPLVVGRRGVGTFVRETVRRDPGDGRWWVRWPVAAFTGGFARHAGRFDPGQRIANAVLVVGILVLAATGIAMTALHGGPVFAWLTRVHRWTTVLITPVIVGHVVIASGVLPGYRGVWRSMHSRGGVPEATARRVWPGWTERELRGGGRER